MRSYNFEKIYVGIRQSDIFFANDFFNDCVCIFNKNAEEPFQIRPNQNINNKSIFTYLKEQVMNLYNENPEKSFIFYNQITAYNYPKEILDRAICINKHEILNILNNKLTLKQWLIDREIPIIPYKTFLGHEIHYNDLLSEYDGYDTFVIQMCHGGGGIGTFKVDSTNYSNILPQLLENQNYIVSPYIENISVNMHVFVSDSKNILTPGSIQIIENRDNQLVYCGCDYNEYQQLPFEIKNKIKKLSIKIARHLNLEGYKGIAGIDFIINKIGDVFCAEINPRFQASTFLLDIFLKNTANKSEASSCYELNEMAFQDQISTSLSYDDNINYSCYYYYNNIDINYSLEKYNIFLKNDVLLFDDGMSEYKKNRKFNKNSYLFRAIFPHNICKISPDFELWINDNIKICNIPINTIDLKIRLLNQGVRLENNSFPIKRGVYESIDIIVPHLKEKLYMNCAYNIHLSKYSPFLLKMDKSVANLFYYKQKICDVIVEKDKLHSFSELEKSILYISSDRLRIKLLAGCENKNINQGCKFCNLPISKKQFSLEEIISALEHVKKQKISFRHILIGGGTSLSNETWYKIIKLCTYLKNDTFYTNKPISLMSILPPINILQDLKKAGVEEVAFNIEIANETLAKKLMPKKRSVSKESYYNILNESVKVFGIGNVRSALVVGIDKKADLYDEVMLLANMNVLPCLSAFRALPNSEFEDDLGPSNDYLLETYYNTISLLSLAKGSIHELGPKCTACRNNMLIL